MKRILLSLIQILLPLAVNADAVEIDGIYYILVPKAKAAEVNISLKKLSKKQKIMVVSLAVNLADPNALKITLNIEVW